MKKLKAITSFFSKKTKSKENKEDWKKLDPHHQREQERYVSPIPSREYIAEILRDAKTPLMLDDLIVILRIKDEQSRDGLRRRLRAMEREQQLIVTEAGAYRAFVEGQDVARVTTSHAHFVVPEEKVNLEIAARLAIEEHHLPHQWSEQLFAETKKIALEISPQEIAKRRDLRDLPLVTIDGDDAKDFDDAVYCERVGRDYRLIVAIADVSYYVRPGAVLDVEAETRGNSVYFPGMVIPMLPEILSNELCSLKPNVDRLCLVADMIITQTGELKNFEFYQGVMRSKARLTYSQVAKILDQPELISEVPYLQFSHVWEHVFDLYALYQILYASREKRGALDFDTVEGALIFNDQGEVVDIKAVVRTDAHKLIEEAMLMANVAAARLLEEHELTGLYRIHEGLREEKYPDLKDFFSTRGLKIGAHVPGVKELSNILKATHDRPDYSILQTVVLRSMTQAVYSSNNVGHYGLAYDSYTHFTSPIRRYPDLLVHRLIRKVLSSNDPSAKAYGEEELNALCIHTSQTERRADEASRQVVFMLKCGFLQKHLGKEFSGIISSVTNFGLFVTLADLLIDGLVHVTSLPSDFYHFDPVHHRLQGERSGRMFQIGQELKVRVAKVNPMDRKIDFLIAGYESNQRRSSFKRKRRAPNKKKGA